MDYKNALRFVDMMNRFVTNGFYAIKMDGEQAGFYREIDTEDYPPHILLCCDQEEYDLLMMECETELQSVPKHDWSLNEDFGRYLFFYWLEE
jgi:hypothetical protein